MIFQLPSSTSSSPKGGAGGRFPPRPADVREPLAAEQVAAEVIDDRQRVAVDPVPHPELALEIDRPDLIRGDRGDRHPARMFPVVPATAMPDTVVAGENVKDGAPGGPRPLRIPGLQALPNLAGPPSESGMFPQNQLDDVVGRLVWRGSRGPTVIVQSLHAMLAVAMGPLVTGVATDAVPLAELGHRPLAALEIVHKMVSFEHGIGLLPGHRFSSHEGWEKCQPCARTPVTYGPGLYRAGGITTRWSG